MKYTREQILAMDATQLRLAIAEKLGYVKAFGRMDSASQRDHVFYVKPDGRFTSYIPDWPNSISEAWGLAEEMRSSEKWIAVDSVSDGWVCLAGGACESEHWCSGFPGDTAPLAICRAWLMWKEGV